jgi:hypothetical protein
MGLGMDVGRRDSPRRTRWIAGLVAAALVAILAVPTAASAGVAGGTPAGDCQPFTDEPCLLPFPNNLYTKPDKNSKTGLSVDLPQAAMPTNEAGDQMDVGPYNRNDGFSPGGMIVARVPGLDNPDALAQTNPIPLTDMSQAFKKRAPMVVIDEKTKKRKLIWAELDSNADGPENTTLIIHPGKNLDYGHTYAVAMRNLKDANGDKLDAPKWFEKLRDGKRLPPDERSQKSRYERIFKILKKAGIKRGNLYMAWDFTVASRKSLTQNLLHIRNAAFRGLGDDDLADSQVAGHAPRFKVKDVESNPDPGIASYVTGTFQVPCYLRDDGCPPGSTFNYASAKRYANPKKLDGNVAKAPFYCIIPTVASPANPARGSVYGHGLLGSGSQVESEDGVRALASEHNFILCATDWWGMSSGDVPYDIQALSDLNKFPAVVDRLQQGVLNTLFLSRLMRTDNGFASDPAFQKNGQSLLDTSHGYYYGLSQGGIMGGITTAVAPDFTQSVLGVNGMDYGGLLLQRSTDFTAYSLFLYGKAGSGGYPDTSIHPLLLDLMQQLWDRGEPDGYAARMTTDPLPKTPAHQVLMQTAYGDFQVSQYSAAVEARTIGAYGYQPALDIPPRGQDENLFYRIPTIPSDPYDGSAWVIWDSGPGHTLDPPTTNTAPEESETPPVNLDPHSDPRDTSAARTQVAEFLQPNGKVVDVCNGDPCHSHDYTP